MRKLTLENFQQRLKEVYPDEELKAISWDGGQKEAEVLCMTCGAHYKKIGNCFLDKRKISICKTCHPTQPGVLKTEWNPPEGYEQLSPYTGMSHKVLLRCKKCGFIWGMTPTNLKLGKGCPKCNKKISKGEKKIKEYLDNNNINYIWQYPIKIKEHHLSIDFYLPDDDLYIEYNGEQHYEPVPFFGGEEKFQKQQLLDSYKQEALKEKLLIISYLDFDNIQNILESSTTIPNGSTSQANGDGSGKDLKI